MLLWSSWDMQKSMIGGGSHQIDGAVIILNPWTIFTLIFLSMNEDLNLHLNMCFITHKSIGHQFLPPYNHPWYFQFTFDEHRLVCKYWICGVRTQIGANEWELVACTWNDTCYFYFSPLCICIEKYFGLLVSRWRILCLILEVKLNNMGNQIFDCPPKLSHWWGESFQW